MKVKAISQGWDGSKLQEAGDIFEVPDGMKGKWFVPVTETKASQDPKTSDQSDFV